MTSIHPARCFCHVLLVLALAAATDAQQPNGSTASLRINGFDDLNYPLSPVLSAAGFHTFGFGGGALQPFVLFHGSVSPGFLNAGPTGLADLDIHAAGFTKVLDGVNPMSPLDGLASLDAAGARAISLPIPPGYVGNFGGLQALVVDPTGSSGFKLSAATHLDVVAGFTLTTVSPSVANPGGGQFVTIVGTGFVPGTLVTVTFDGAVAPFASAFSSTIVIATTPQGLPGSTGDVVVTQSGVSQALPGAFTFAGVAHPPILINEISTGAPDFVELYNPNNVAVDISGWSLHSWYHGTTPDPGSPHVFAFGTVLQPGAVLVIQEQGQAHQPGTLPQSIGTGHDFWWSGSRQVEVALLDDQGLGVDYFHRKWNGTEHAPNLPFPLVWTGEITTSDDHLWRDDALDTNDATDFVPSATGSPGSLNPGQ